MNLSNRVELIYTGTGSGKIDPLTGKVESNEKSFIVPAKVTPGSDTKKEFINSSFKGKEMFVVVLRIKTDKKPNFILYDNKRYKVISSKGNRIYYIGDMK